MDFLSNVSLNVFKEKILDKLFNSTMDANVSEKNRKILIAKLLLIHGIANLSKTHVRVGYYYDIDCEDDSVFVELKCSNPDSHIFSYKIGDFEIENEYLLALNERTYAITQENHHAFFNNVIKHIIKQFDKFIKHLLKDNSEKIIVKLLDRITTGIGYVNANIKDVILTFFEDECDELRNNANKLDIANVDLNEDAISDAYVKCLKEQYCEKA